MSMLQVTKRALAMALVLSWAGACDPDPAEVAKGNSEPGKSDAGGKATEPSKATGPGPAEPQAPEVAKGESPPTPAAMTLNECYADCESAQLSEDDRATCRVRCKSLAPDSAGPGRNPILGAYLGCFDGCAGKSADDQPTCHKNCAASVTAGSGDPATTACPRACTEAFGSCLSPCESKSEDNAATCRKQCEAIAQKCVAACK